MERFLQVLLLASVLASVSSDLRFVCEGDNVEKWIYCNNPKYGIHVEKATFGRIQENVCPNTGNKTKQNCGEKNVRDIIRTVCDGKSRCDRFVVDADKFGEMEECKNVSMYMTVNYECLKITGRTGEEQEEFEESEGTGVVLKSDLVKTSSVQYQVKHADAASSLRPVGFTALLCVAVFLKTVQ